MSKTPITSLQEIMAKGSYGLPIYDLISETNGTHLASFTYRVKCVFSSGTQTAVGTASSKKEAKHKAAREMLKILDIKNINSSKIIDLIPSGNKSTTINSYYEPGASNASPREIFVNSIGKLNEFCQTHRLIAPNFEVRNASGPSHMMTFTMICTVGKLKTQATATTKKQAKHDAAQEMLRTLMTSSPSKDTTDESFNFLNIKREIEGNLPALNMLDLKLEEPKISSQKSAELAKKLFPKLTNGSVKIVQDIHVKDYHKALKASIDSVVRENVQKILKLITSESRIEDELNKIAKLMGTKLNFNNLLQSGNDCVVNCFFELTPVLADFGIGRTIGEAKTKAMTNLLVTISTLLR